MSVWNFEADWTIFDANTPNAPLIVCKTLFNNQYDFTLGDPVVGDIIQDVVSNFENATGVCIDQSGDDTTFNFDFPDQVEISEVPQAIKNINTFISDLEIALVKYKI